MKQIAQLCLLLILASCSGVTIKRTPASLPQEVVVAETFNPQGMKYASGAPKGFRLASCSLRSVRVHHKEVKPIRALAVVFTHTNERGEQWSSPYYYLAYEKSDKTLTMIDTNGKEVGSRFLKRKGKVYTNSYFNKELREFGFENLNEKSSIKLYRSTKNNKIQSACVF